MRDKIYTIISSPFFKLPLLLTGVIITEKLLLRCYTYLEKSDFDLM